jgi:hypothetical protein
MVHQLTRRGGFISASLVQFFRLDLIKWLGLIRDMRLLPKIGGVDFSDVFLQKFEGNVTILPSGASLIDYFRILEDPSRERMASFIREGESATWPKLCMIANRWKIEHFLMEMRARTHLETSRRHSFFN